MAKISTLIDDFSDNVINPSLWTTTGTVAETGGRVVLTPALGVPARLGATSLYDLSSSQITIDVPVVTATGTSGTLSCGMAVGINDNNVVGFKKVGANLFASYVVGGVPTDVFAATYNSTNHRYWRIRADSSNVYWETSATGTGAFFIQATQNISALFPVNVVGTYFYAFYTGPEAAPGTMQLEGVNPGVSLSLSGASTSAGQLTLRRVLLLNLSAASASSGSLALTVSASPIKQLTFSAASTSAGSLSFITVSPGQLSFNGASNSSGSLSFIQTKTLSFTGSSFATGTLSITLVRAVVDPLLIQYFIFEPPIVYDRPAIHSKTPRRVRSLLYYNAHSLGATGVSVLKLDGVYQTIYTPTVDQINAATKVYQGGHVYTIPQSDADELVAAGYTVTPLPVPTPQMTVFPEEDLYPSEDLFPGYHDTVLVS